MGAGPSGEPIRMCIGCRTREPVSRLVRLVVDAHGRCVVDTERTLPGRGAHIHPRVECIDQAAARRALPRALGSRGGARLDISQVRAEVLG